MWKPATQVISRRLADLECGNWLRVIEMVEIHWEISSSGMKVTSRILRTFLKIKTGLPIPDRNSRPPVYCSIAYYKPFVILKPPPSESTTMDRLPQVVSVGMKLIWTNCKSLYD